METKITMQGYVHIYTGDGKGKTTAALGLILRASGAGFKTFFCQFIKGMESSELSMLRENIHGVVCRQYGLGRFLTPENPPTKDDIESAQNGFTELMKEMLSEKYNLIIADELNVAVEKGLIETAQVCALIDKKPDETELVLTGRNASAEIIAKADLVTEMRNLKHYSDKKVLARKGIEY